MPFTAKKLTPIDPSTLEKLGVGTVDLSKYVEEEFSQVAKAIQSTEPDQVWNSVPPRPRRGTTAYADGTHWNPGSGEGPYFYNGTSWFSMKAPSGFLVDAPSDGKLYGRMNGAWTTALAVAGGQTTTGGFNITPYSIGTITTGTVTPNAINQNYQYYTNNGAHTLAAPASDCAIDILITNGAAAGAITFSGFTVAAGNTGDPLTTTNTSKFIVSIRRINAISTYVIKALQ